MKYSIIFSFLVLITLSNCKKKAPKIIELINKETFVFKNNKNLEAFVPEKITFRDEDCATMKNEFWKITNFSDSNYIELTINTTDGIKPGKSEAKAFLLTNELSDGTTSIDPIKLFIQSDSNNTKLVYQVSWKFTLNAVEDIENEIITNGIQNTLPFERKIKSIKLGSKWLLTIPITQKPESIYATIRYNIKMESVKSCPY